MIPKGKPNKRKSTRRIRESERGLMWGSHNLVDLASQLERPAYVYDLDLLQDRVHLFNSRVLSPLQEECSVAGQVYFALKSNHSREVLRILRDESSFGVDAVSGGELALAVDEKFSPERILFSGVGKSTQDMEQAIRSGVRRVVVERFEELLEWDKICRRIGPSEDLSSSSQEFSFYQETPGSRGFPQKLEILLRLNPDVRAPTHAKIATGSSSDKFGLNELEFRQSVALLSRSAHLQWAGVHIHLGSLMTRFSSLLLALRRAEEISWEHVRTQSAPSSFIFDVGGGLGFDYTQDSSSDHKVFDAYGKTLVQFFRQLQKKWRGISLEVIFEPGRSLVGRAGILLTRVITVKNRGRKRLVILESGMNHLMRPALYDSFHRIFEVSPHKASGRNLLACKVAGPICESSDMFPGEFKFSKTIARGSWVAIADVGAYGEVLANDYNLFPRPEAIFISDKRSTRTL